MLAVDDYVSRCVLVGHSRTLVSLTATRKYWRYARHTVASLATT